MSIDFLVMILCGSADDGVDAFFLAGTLKNSFDSEFIIGFLL
jgi:hypothetical protein